MNDQQTPIKNIVLIGLMGVGKTTTGLQIAKRLNRPFIDTDDHIEMIAGMSIAEIFAREGEEGFRARETDVVADIAQNYGQIIAVGGGTATIAKNIAALRKTGIVIWLNADVSVLLTRLGSRVSRAHRPLLADARSAEELETTLRALQEERKEAYRQAAHETITITHDECRATVIKQILAATERHTQPDT